MAGQSMWKKFTPCSVLREYPCFVADMTHGGIHWAMCSIGLYCSEFVLLMNLSSQTPSFTTVIDYLKTNCVIQCISQGCIEVLTTKSLTLTTEAVNSWWKIHKIAKIVSYSGWIFRFHFDGMLPNSACNIIGRLRSRSIHHKALNEHCELNILGACTYHMSTEPSYRIHEGRGDNSNHFHGLPHRFLQRGCKCSACHYSDVADLLALKGRGVFSVTFRNFPLRKVAEPENKCCYSPYLPSILASYLRW